MPLLMRRCCTRIALKIRGSRAASEIRPEVFASPAGRSVETAEYRRRELEPGGDCPPGVTEHLIFVSLAEAMSFAKRR
jgi:hypothetical protein